MATLLASDQSSRFAALRSLDILDTSSEHAFDRLTRLAAEAIGAPVACFSLVDEARVWLKSHHGTEVCETRLEDAFCPLVVSEAQLVVIEDASRDPRFAASRLVTENGFRFYAGAPIALATGEIVGTICAIDFKTRGRPAAAPLALLQGLAYAAGHLLDLRRELLARRDAEISMREHARLLELAEEMAGIGTWRLDFETGHIAQSPGINRIYGLRADQPTPDVEALLAMYEPVDRSRIVASLERARATGHGYSLDATLRRADDGARREVRVKASVEKDVDGRPYRLVGVLRDVSVEKKTFGLLNAQRIEANRRAHRLGQLASTDALTNLPNRRAFMEQLGASLTSDADIHLAIVDLDHFKAINDRHGHDIGDEALSRFGRACALLRDGTCYPGRIGGEEFGLLMSGMSAATAASRLDLLRRICLHDPIEVRRGLEIRLTFSAGIACAVTGDDQRSLFQRADQALYAAKRDGRDRTILAA